MVINPSTGARGYRNRRRGGGFLIGEAADTGPFVRPDGWVDPGDVLRVGHTLDVEVGSS